MKVQTAASYVCSNPECESQSFTGWYHVDQKWAINMVGDQDSIIDEEVVEGPDYITCTECGNGAQWTEMPIPEYIEKYGEEPPDWVISSVDMSDETCKALGFELPYNSPFDVI